MSAAHGMAALDCNSLLNPLVPPRRAAESNFREPQTDLTKADFELFEDGVRQEIADVTVVRVGDSSAPGPDDSSAPAVRRTTGARSTPAFTAIVFDRIAPEVRAKVAKAALTLVETLREDDFAGVFMIDHSLRILQTYTTDRAALRRALDVVLCEYSAGREVRQNCSDRPESACPP